MKLGIVCAVPMSKFWTSVANAAVANLDTVFYYGNAAIDEAAAFEKFLEQCNAVWVPGTTANLNGGTSKPVLYNPFSENGVEITNGWPSLPLRFRPEMRHLKEFVASDKLGQLGTVRISLCRSSTTSGPLCYSDSDSHEGALVQLGVHGFDAITWCFGEIERVHAVQSTEPAETAQYALAVARLASGAIAHLECSLAEQAGGDYLYYEVTGTNGILEYDSRKEPTIAFQTTVAKGGDFRLPTELVFELRRFLSGEGASLASVQDAVTAANWAFAAADSMKVPA